MNKQTTKSTLFMKNWEKKTNFPNWMLSCRHWSREQAHDNQFLVFVDFVSFPFGLCGVVLVAW